MVEQFKFDQLKKEYEDLKLSHEKIKYFNQIPNMDTYKNIKGYAIGHLLGLNNSPFLKTLNAINHFVG